MREFILVTDSDTEIPLEFAKEYSIPTFFMPYTLDGVEAFYDLGEKCDEGEFFNKLRKGSSASTSTRPPQDIAEFFKEQLAKGLDILYLCFSSNLSGHYELSLLAREEALSEYPDAEIEIVDTLKVSMAAGILVMHAAVLWKKGESLEFVRDWVLNNRNRVNAWFMVDDLNYLKRGGRLSGTQAFLGNILDVKPMLVVSKDGRILNVDKEHGKKKAYAYLLKKVSDHIQNPEKQEIFVLHGGVLDEATELKNLLAEHITIKSINIKFVGPVIGAHCGPNVLAVIFMGKEVPV